MRVLQIFARRFAASLTFVLPKASAGKTAGDDKPRAPVEPWPDSLTFEAEDPDDAEYRAVASHIANLMLADEWVEIGEQITLRR